MKYGFSTELLDIREVQEANCIQTDAFSILKTNLKKIKANKIIVNRIHTYAQIKRFGNYINLQKVTGIRS